MNFTREPEIVAKEACEHMRWMAQTIHQAYHQDQGRVWQLCPRDVCKSTMDWMLWKSGDMITGGKP